MPETIELLLEVGCEEMPAPWLPSLTAQLRDRFTGTASKEHLEPQAAASFSTPRRLVLRAEVRRRQEDREETVFGPALKSAKDAAGKWTAAAQGFARKNGVSPEELGEAPKDPSRPEEKNLVFRKKVPGRDAQDVVPALLPGLLRGLAFPKRMSWDAWLDDGKGAFPFGRPIRWIVALLGGQVLNCDIFELVAGGKGPVLVRAGDLTFGHRFLPRGAAGGPIRVTGFTDLEAKLGGAAVVLRSELRRKSIEAALLSAGTVDDDHGLVDEWQDLVEHPAVVVGGVPAEFRSLPREVLETVLVHHQKYVPLVEGGSVVRFAALTNSDGQAAAPIVRNMERVVVARLRDAAFFWREDKKRLMSDRVADLAGVAFHQGLGTYLDKTERVVSLVEGMGRDGSLASESGAAAAAAARLAKADLTTAMVREFPELQGVMGSLYLEAEGAAPEVAAAVRWHYHPLSVDADSAPAGKLMGPALGPFAALSLADKLDTLAGYFGLELEPTGSSDPFGLRRAGQGAVRVLLDFWPVDRAVPSLRTLLQQAIARYRDGLKRMGDKLSGSLELFLLGRLEHVLEARGYPKDEVSAVVSWDPAEAGQKPHPLDDVRDGLARLEALHRSRAQARDDFEQLAVAFKRAKNILTKEAAPGAIEPALFEHDAERELFAAVESLRQANGGYDDRLRSLAGLRKPVDRFFDDVLVMAEDAKVRANRLALLHRTLSLFYKIADISRLGGQA